MPPRPHETPRNVHRRLAGALAPCQADFMSLRIRTWLPLLSTIGVVGCATYETLSKDQYLSAQPPAKSVQDAIERGGKTKDPGPAKLEVSGPETKPVVYGSSKWDCKVEKVSMQENPADFMTMDPNADVIFPGALIRGDSLQSGYRNIIAKRGAGNVTLTLVTGAVAGSQTRDMPELKFQAMVDAQNEIIQALNARGAAVPAQISQEVKVFDSADEFAAQAGFSTTYGAGPIKSSISASVDFSTQTRKSRIFAKVVQRYFTMVYNRSGLDPNAFFAPDVNVVELGKQIGPSSPATYVKSVTYGRIAYMIIESDSSKTELKAAFTGDFPTTTVNVATQMAKTRKSASIKVIGLGGNVTSLQDAAAKAVESLQDDTRQPLAAMSSLIADKDSVTFGDKNPPLPISFEIRNIVDDSVVQNAVTSEYTRRSCLPVLDGGKVKLSLDATKATYDGSGKMTAWAGAPSSPNSIYGVEKGDLNGKIAAKFIYGDSYASGIDCGFAVNNPYTIAMVVRADEIVPVSRERTCFLCSGTEPTPPPWLNDILSSQDNGARRFLQIGWEQTSQLHVGHGDADRFFALEQQPAGHVVFVSHSQELGHQAWSNGDWASPDLPVRRVERVYAATLASKASSA